MKIPRENLVVYSLDKLTFLGEKNAANADQLSELQTTYYGRSHAAL
jgi:hypothetical protein